jgi:hypothetical protein
MKYTVTSFPSYLGTPYKTNWWIISRLVAIHRTLRFVEVRINGEVWSG